MKCHRFGKPRLIGLAPIMLLFLAFATACGTAATATPPPATNTPAPASPTATPATAGAEPTTPPQDTGATAAPSATSDREGAGINRADVVRADADPDAKYGGVLRWIGYPDSAHFDLAQNTSVVNSVYQMMLYNGILRYNPYDAGDTIIPDLATGWQISEDGRVWTFPLREGVRFTDGAELTSEDVVATWDRILNPPVGVSMPRKEIYEGYGAQVSAVDPLTVQFTFDSAPPLDYMLNGFALEWHGIHRKATLEENDYDLKTNGHMIPTTGAFKYVRYQVGEVWRNEKNPDYWNEGLPYLDGVDIFVSLNASTRAAAFLAHQADYVQTISPEGFDALANDPTAVRDNTISSYSHGAIWFNMDKPMFQNAKLRQAMRYAIDPMVIREATLDWLFTYEGGRGWTFPEQAYEPPEDQVQARLIFNRDAVVAEAKRLMTEARAELGLAPNASLGSLDLIVRQSNAQYEVQAQIAQLSWRRELGIDTNIRVVPSAQWLEESRRGNFDISLGATASPFIDPSAYWGLWYRQGSSENFSRYHNPEFEALLDQIDSEGDFDRRYALVQQAAEILDNDPPSIELFYNRTLSAWRTNVKGITGKRGALVHNLSRFDTIWLDQ